MAHYPQSLVNINTSWYKYTWSLKREKNIYQNCWLSWNLSTKNSYIATLDFCFVAIIHSSDTFAQTIFTELEIWDGKNCIWRQGLTTYLWKFATKLRHYLSLHCLLPPRLTGDTRKCYFPPPEEIQLETKPRNARLSGIWGGCHEQKCVRI